jgi:hypothetical protein
MPGKLVRRTCGGLVAKAAKRAVSESRETNVEPWDRSRALNLAAFAGRQGWKRDCVLNSLFQAVKD